MEIDHPVRVSQSLPHSYHGAHVATTCRVRQNGTTQNAQHRNQYASTERHDSREERRAEEVKVVVHLLLLGLVRDRASEPNVAALAASSRGGRRGGLARSSLLAVSAAAAAAADTIRTSAAPSGSGSRTTTPRPPRRASSARAGQQAAHPVPPSPQPYPRVARGGCLILARGTGARAPQTPSLRKEPGAALASKLF